MKGPELERRQGSRTKQKNKGKADGAPSERFELSFRPGKNGRKSNATTETPYGIFAGALGGQPATGDQGENQTEETYDPANHMAFAHHGAGEGCPKNGAVRWGVRCPLGNLEASKLTTVSLED